MPHELPKAYEPGAIEARWAEYWVREKLFHVETPGSGQSPDTTRVFALLLPPPNVTGRLHMGHMLNQTQMDIIVRWHRMRGFVSLWLPGTDHAGIATQMMVERQLATEGKKRREMGREAFIERVWEWKRHYGGAILDQMKRLGASVDWGREYFTMDDKLSRAVKEVFVRLYEDGLIYRGKYIVNWCSDCGTAISDLEVKHEDVAGKLYEIRYPVVVGAGQSPATTQSTEGVARQEYIVVATTRPETMLGDTAVAVNPTDERYLHLHGKRVMLPLMNREIPIIADELAQPEFGTGAVKVTPAHDPNDFEAGLRHNLPQIEVIDEHARMNANAGVYAGLDRFAARARIVEDLAEQGFLVGTKDYTIALGKCDRSGTIVEPRLSTQWFVKIAPLAARAIEVVEKGYIRFTPENYGQIYLNWMRNIHDWCISRQLWWGHRIPAWYCGDCKEVVVAREAPAACKCGSTRLEQDTDVLDTWFSSGLLPFTTLGWPEATRDLEVFYPNSLMITGFDILFFWVARMIMLGCWFMMPPHKPTLNGPALDRPTLNASKSEAFRMGHPESVRRASEDQLLRESVPFREVYIHALVRDAERQKMSKTKGNVLDPIEVIGQYGTDATRFTLAAMAAPGTDIAFSESRTAGYRNFANKIWNAARFMFMNVDRIDAGLRPSDAMAEAGLRPGDGRDARRSTSAGVGGFRASSLEDRWILSRFNRAAGDVNSSLAAYRFDEAANRIYDFFWGEFCDWYLELIKPRLNEEPGLRPEGGQESPPHTACANLVNLFEASLRLLHPVMPFITEEIWQAMYDGAPPLKSIALAAYPAADEAQIDLAAETEMAILQDLIVSVRNLRAELKVEPKVKVPIEVFAHEAEIRRLLEENLTAIERLGSVETMTFVASSLEKVAGARSTSRFDVHVVYEKKIDVAAERERLTKELEKMEKEQANGARQLSNEQFLAKAPAKVVEGLRARAEELRVLREKAVSKLKELG
ncbi:MAG: valine--tRNA ligase [Terriglobales bacterium]|jgi:valyl-tRNA synthetase